MSWPRSFACFTTIPSTATRRVIRAMACRQSRPIRAARRRRRPKPSTSRPAQLLGSVSGELGLRSFLESAGHTFVVTSDKDGPDSVFERELADAEVVISQPFWPAYLTAERIAKAREPQARDHCRHRLGPRRPAGRDRARHHRRRGDLLQQHQRRRARRDDDPGAGAQLHPVVRVGRARAAGTSPTASSAPTTSRA